MRFAMLLLMLAVAACAAAAPAQRITVEADYNLQSLVDDEYAQGHAASPPKKVYVTSNPRSLIAEDIIRRQILRSSSITSADLAAADIVVEIQDYNTEINDEGGNVEPVLIDKSSVPNFLGAALLMPKSSSYSIEIQRQRIVGSYEVAYTLGAAGMAGAAPHVMRDNIELKATTCTQPKVINAFGGVTAADFWASDQLKTLCTNSGPPISRQIAQERIESAIGQAIRGEIINIAIASSAATTATSKESP